MSGFLPLVEGFLAFAITMLALTTGVSAIVGVLHRLRRRRARGLREMVRLLYLNEIATAPGLTGRQEVDSLEPVGKSSILKRVQNDFRSLLNRGEGSAERDAAEGEKEGRKQALHRAQFIADMTLMPSPTLVADLDSEDSSWLKRIARAEVLAMRRDKPVLNPVPYLSRWRTLRVTLDELSDDEFRVRLAGSKVGGELRKKVLGHEGGAASEDEEKTWSAEVERLLSRFKVLGQAATESFARHSRSWTILVGFLLAVGLNVDSFNLLDTYLTNPQLRAAVVASSEQYLSGERKFEPAEGGTVDRLRAGLEAGLDDARDALAAALAPHGVDRDKLLAALPPPLGSGDPAAQAESLSERLRAALTGLGLDESRVDAVMAKLDKAGDSVVARAERVQRAWEEADAVASELSEAERQVLGVTQALGDSFPIGWERYPGCAVDLFDPKAGAAGRTESSPKPLLDARCLGGRQRVHASAWPKAADGFLGKLVWPFKMLGHVVFKLPWDALAVMSAVAKSSPATFTTWLSGVLLTGLMLGLGTPFWIQVVNGALSLRRRLSGGDADKPGDGNGGGKTGGGG